MKEFFASRSSKRSHFKSVSQVKNPYLKEIRNLRKSIPEWDNFFSEGDEEARGNNWVRLDVLGQPLNDKYAWAIPNKRALNILAEFSPLIEVGCGKGYWASLLREMGVDIVCYDKKKSPQAWTDVRVGGPRVLNESAAEGRTLFLCYPDDSNNLALKCLERYSGDYIIHVGELITTGTLSGQPQAPFGRTTGSEFSVALAESFHCLLVASLPRFPFSKDCITVWKRTVFVPGKSAMLSSSDSEEEEEEVEVSQKRVEKGQGKGQQRASSRKDSDSSSGEGSSNSEDNEGDEEDEEEESEVDGEEEGDSWASIPPEEMLPVDIAAPCLAHLLRRQ